MRHLTIALVLTAAKRRTPATYQGAEPYFWLMLELVRHDGAEAKPVLKRIWESDEAVPLLVREEAQESLIDLGVIGPGDRTIVLIRD